MILEISNIESVRNCYSEQLRMIANMFFLLSFQSCIAFTLLSNIALLQLDLSDFPDLPTLHSSPSFMIILLSKNFEEPGSDVITTLTNILSHKLFQNPFRIHSKYN